MTINEYIALKKKADDVWCDLDNHLMEDDLKYHANIDDLISEAKELISNYESLVVQLFDKIQIENCVP